MICRLVCGLHEHGRRLGVAYLMYESNHIHSALVIPSSVHNGDASRYEGNGHGRPDKADMIWVEAVMATLSTGEEDVGFHSQTSCTTVVRSIGRPGSRIARRLQPSSLSSSQLCFRGVVVSP